jgi:hypothetical protein
LHNKNVGEIRNAREDMNRGFCETSGSLNTFTLSNYYAGYIPNLINFISLVLTKALQNKDKLATALLLQYKSCTHYIKYRLPAELFVAPPTLYSL